MMDIPPVVSLLVEIAHTWSKYKLDIKKGNIDLHQVKIWTVPTDLDLKTNQNESIILITFTQMLHSRDMKEATNHFSKSIAKRKETEKKDHDIGLHSSC